ncbi:MAG: hypothetical protein AAGF10_03950 [Verrucomicrobiota bacterium]
MHVLPSQQASAAANMAIDLLLLEAYPEPKLPRFRSYGWTLPAWSFGLSQKWEALHERILSLPCEVVRRPTGGGLVDHLQDWTFSLVIPPSSPGYRDNPTELYRLVHEKAIAALSLQGLGAQLYEVANTTGLRPVCFAAAERFDVVLPSGEKIAGAAQKRNKHGLLIQGSITRLLPEKIDWDMFADQFAYGLGDYLGSRPEQVAWPALDEERLASETERFASDSWNRRH